MNTPYNLRAWREWSDAEPPPCAARCVEAEYVDATGMLAYAAISLFHYAEESRWGFGTGDWREGTYKTNHPKFHRWRYVGPIVPSREAQGCSIVVWSFYDAPGELRALSNHGGDEDWVALVPKDVERPSWTASGTSFGCCDVSEHVYEDGRTVCIGAHA